MTLFKDLVLFLKNRKEMTRLYFGAVGKAEEAQNLYEEMKRLYLMQGEPTFNPAEKIGLALKMADEYHITLHQGTCAGHCRAELAKEHWVRPIPLHVDPGVYADFLIVGAEEVVHINGWDDDPAFAICKCLIKARKAQVIDPVNVTTIVHRRKIVETWYPAKETC